MILAPILTISFLSKGSEVSELEVKWNPSPGAMSYQIRARKLSGPETDTVTWNSDGLKTSLLILLDSDQVWTIDVRAVGRYQVVSDWSEPVSTSNEPVVPGNAPDVIVAMVQTEEGELVVATRSNVYTFDTSTAVWKVLGNWEGSTDE